MQVDLNQAAINKLNHAVNILLNPCDPEDFIKSNSFFLYIRRLLKQRKIISIEEKEVFTEAYLRALQYINKHKKEIENPIPFLKRTALNYVREVSRKQAKYLSYDPIILDNQPNPVQTNIENYIESFSDEQLQNFDSLLKKLSWLDYKILELWQIRDMKWKDIVDELKKHDQFLSTISARKRGERIMKKLKQQMN